MREIQPINTLRIIVDARAELNSMRLSWKFLFYTPQPRARLINVIMKYVVDDDDMKLRDD